jgi:hypothetical protein
MKKPRTLGEVAFELELSLESVVGQPSLCEDEAVLAVNVLSLEVSGGDERRT